MTNTVMAKTGALIRLTYDLARRELLAVTVAVLGISASDVALDIFFGEPASFFVSGVAWFVAAAIINFNVLRHIYPEAHNMQSRMVRLFGLSLMASLAMLAGLVFLVLPGIYLFLRWFTIWPVLVHHDAGIMDTLRSGWEETRGWEWPVLIVVVASTLPVIIATVLFAIAGFDLENPGIIWLGFLLNFLGYLPGMLSYIASVACHALINGSTIDRNVA